MEATLKFQLPEEEHEHLLAIHAVELYRCITDIDNKLRNLLKHGNIEDLTLDQLADYIRSEFRDVLNLIDY